MMTRCDKEDKVARSHVDTLAARLEGRHTVAHPPRELLMDRH